MRVSLTRVPLDEVPWDELDIRQDRTIYQTRAWLDFLSATQSAEPVAARVTKDGAQIGWFTGATVRRFGVRVLGSPLPGWTTSYMGFNLDVDCARAEILRGLARFAFTELGCLHFELMDRKFESSADVSLPGRAAVTPFHSFELSLGSDEALLAGMSQNARRNIRRSQARSVVVEEVGMQEIPEFAAAYYSQVSKAFAKRDLRPTFQPDRVEQMLERLLPTGNLLALRARTADGECAATGIFPGLAGSYATFWMGSSEPELLDHRPNEAVMWYALREWRDRGAKRFDFGGGGSYKAKYGGTPVEVDWVRWSRLPGMEFVRSAVRAKVKKSQSLASRPGS